MNRRQFVRKLTQQGCYLHKHGHQHDIYVNSRTGKRAPVPRHPEIAESLCDLIKQQLGLK